METVPILTVREAAKLLGYHEEYVRKLARDGKLASRRIGRSFVFEVATVEAWKAARQQAKLAM